MENEQFWTSQDGRIEESRLKKNGHLRVKIAFAEREPGEFSVFADRLDVLNFSLRSTLARIGFEMILSSPPKISGDRIIAEAEAFLFDPDLPHSAYWKDLMRPGVPAGRLYFAPESAKMDSTEILEAIGTNRLKLPDSISIDRAGNVALTPHHVRYTLSDRLQRPQIERLVNGAAGRSFLDKVQLRRDTSLLIVPPRSGVVTSCSIYLKEHYVILNRGVGDFGLHTSAVLLDPVLTSGTNVMLEIYNTGDQPVVNPLVSVEVFRAPPLDDRGFRMLRKRRLRLVEAARKVYHTFDNEPPVVRKAALPDTSLTVRGESSEMNNRCLFLTAGAAGKARKLIVDLESEGFPTLRDALSESSNEADTLLIDYFPSLFENIEILARLPNLALRRIIFRKPSRDHGFFLSNSAHYRLDVYRELGIEVYWYNADLDDLFVHTYKRSHGFFVRDELRKRFQEATIFAFYGSSVGLEQDDIDRISGLIDNLTDFIGGNVGILTGGGGGVMRLATDQARSRGAMTGACFLELEAQPPEMGVDFFNTFQDTARHNRQKWFEVADFCVFNVGGMGTLEEIGIEMCNLKLGIRPRAPYVFFNASYWEDLRKLISNMIQTGRAPAWVGDYVLFTDKPEEVVEFYRKTLRVL